MADTIPTQPWQKDYLSAQRRRQLAQHLMQGATTPAQGGMVGRYYVGEGLGSGMARLGQALLARSMNKSADQTESDALMAKQKMNADATGALIKALSPQTGMVQESVTGEGMSIPKSVPLKGTIDMPAPTATYSYEQTRRPTQQQLAAALLQYQNTTGQTLPDGVLKMLNPEPMKVGQGETLISPTDNSVIFNNPKTPDGMLFQDGQFSWTPGYLEGKERLAKAGRATTNISIDNKEFKSAFDKESGKSDAEFLSELRNRARASQDTISILGQLEALGDKTFSGAGADWKLNTEKFFGAMGIPVSQEAINSENFRSVAGDLVLSRIRALGSNPTEGERKFVEDLVPQLGTSADARKRLIEFMRAKAEGVIKDFQDANAYIDKNGNLRGYVGGGFKPPAAAGGTKSLEEIFGGL